MDDCSCAPGCTCKYACDTCAHVEDRTVDDDGYPMVRCELNKRQMFAPMAEECKHWLRKVDR